MHYDKDFALECRIARFHNIYGPYGTWKGGREKAPAAFCRKASLVARLLCAVLRVCFVLYCSSAAAVFFVHETDSATWVASNHFCLPQ